jgi:hypothetical protein
MYTSHFKKKWNTMAYPCEGRIDLEDYGIHHAFWSASYEHLIDINLRCKDYYG